jgi:hypothetical protein
LENKDGRLLRNEREVGIERLQLSADGQVLDVATNGSSSGAGANSSDSGTNAWGEQTPPDSADLGHHSEPCDLDFPFGIQNSNECDNRSTYGEYSNITSSQCIFAAEKAGAKTLTDGSFYVPPEWENVHPKGCFVFPCETHSWCYYANDDGAMPSGHILGRPVCRRDRYIHGTAVPGADVNDARMCPLPDYEVIESEEACRKVASCLGDCEEQRFGIGQTHEADKDIYPPGCFLKASSSSSRACVQWNNPRYNGGQLFAPMNPVGTPICVVSQPDVVGILNKDDFTAAPR